MNLDFPNLDGLLTAAHFEGVDVSPHLRNAVALRIGPVVELLLHARSRVFNARTLPESPIVTGVRSVIGSTPPGIGHFNSTDDLHVGFILTNRDPLNGDTSTWHTFCFRAQQAAEKCGLPRQTAQQLVGAIREMEDNIHQHSNRAQDGIVGFRATSQEFEFVVADSGIGALQSLRQHTDYAELNDAGRALELVLSPGESRFGRSSGHGTGFRELFLGLAGLNGLLRFRTEDHALTIDGSSPSLVSSQLRQKVPLKGFLASVVCAYGSIGGQTGPRRGD